MSLPWVLPRPRIAYVREPEDAAEEQPEDAASMMSAQNIMTRQVLMAAKKEEAMAALMQLSQDAVGLPLHMLMYVHNEVYQMASAQDAAIVVKDMVEIVEVIMDARSVSRPLRDYLVLAMSTEVNPENKDAYKMAIAELFHEPSEKILSQVFLSYRCIFNSNVSGNPPQPGRRRTRVPTVYQ